ncbi:hypothetical protein M408DRAFT_29390 [Serendipita vermifera MAFF 305830]|uniref:Uncharacterized protein n=1 Tax=Serendipita vermifera MAFF 305830 TaxID=933852 RepID=A0A0C2W5D3_SERVB|nr:hypothetical protein M408DRAFT_29390 [Serendipita vermifera MAFF 305830]
MPFQSATRSPSPPIVAPPMTNPRLSVERYPTNRKRRVVVARPTFRERELQWKSATTLGDKGPVVLDEDALTFTIPSPPLNAVNNEPLPGIIAQLNSHGAKVFLGSQMVRHDVALVVNALKERVLADISDPVHVSPKRRETFENMLWTIMVAGQPLAPIASQSSPAFAIPPIRATSKLTTSIILSHPTQQKVDEIDTYLVRTEALLRHYPIPPSLLLRLAEIASEINGCIFSRLMGSRGAWSLHRCYGGSLILLRWWAATMPEIMMEYRNALSAQAADTFLRSKLRAELCDILMLDPRNDWNLELAIRHGVEEVATFRRRISAAVSHEFDLLVNGARLGTRDS